MTSDITKRQHFHMRAILNNFANSEGCVEVHKKIDGTRSLEKVASRSGRRKYSLFEAQQSWSQELERGFSHPIEKKFLNEVNEVKEGGDVSNHSVISDYYLLWKIRHWYKNQPAPNISPFGKLPTGNISAELDQAVNRAEKCAIGANGVISGFYATALHMKSDFEKERGKLQQYHWQVLESKSSDFVSADCYRSSLAIPISPKILLFGVIKESKRDFATEDFVKEFNELSILQCYSFIFFRPLAN